MTKPSLTDLTPEQAAALTEFATKFGRNWKEKLRDCWLKAACPTFERYHLLQQVRNQHGPSWLAKFTFPTGGAQA